VVGWGWGGDIRFSTVALSWHTLSPICRLSSVSHSCSIDLANDITLSCIGIVLLCLPAHTLLSSFPSLLSLLLKLPGHFNILDLLIDIDHIALLFQNMYLPNEDKCLIIKDNFLNINSIFLIDNISIDLIVSACVNLDPGDLFVEIEIAREKFGKILKFWTV
jgi:hypothetical protein